MGKKYQRFAAEIPGWSNIIGGSGRGCITVKAYNIDKFLEFLSTEKTVYMIYLLGINDKCEITARLCSVYAPRLLSHTKVIPHWAGRNTRGVAQFIGTGLVEILSQPNSPDIHFEAAAEFLKSMMEK